MNISLLTFSYKRFGGIEQVVKNIYNALSDVHNINIISIDERKKNKSTNKLVRIIYNNCFLKHFILKDINDFNSDLIISVHPFLLKYIDFNSNIKIICWVHGIDVFGINGLKIKNKLIRCDKIIAVSHFTKAHMVNELGYSSNIKVINNCVDLNVFKYTKKEKLEMNVFNMLTVGRLSSLERYKGHDLVLKTIKKLKRTMDKKIVYTIVGDGNDRVRLERIVKQERIEDSVIFKGKLSFNDIIEEYKKTDLFIMPSFFHKRKDGTYTGEGLGIVYLEAGAIGRAVIGCNKGGQTDCIFNNYNGKLVEPNVKDISKKILFFMNNLEQCVNMGIKNRKVVEKFFSYQVFKENINKIIDSI